MKPCPKTILISGIFTLLLAACASTSRMINPAPGCYRPHWTIPFKIQKVQRGTQRAFTTHTGSELFLTTFVPGPLPASIYFVLSPESADHSVAGSQRIGIMLDSDRNGTLDCFILGGGTLPDAKGRRIPYNFFALDWDGDGRIEEFISEDLDLDGDRLMDRAAAAVFMAPDPEGRFQRGAYLEGKTITPIPKEGSAFMLKKPLWKDPFPFEDNEVTKMTLFTALQEIWNEDQ